MPAETIPPFRIAIIGAGISGLTNYIALQHLENVEINVYEKAQELKEIGASIGLGPNGLRGLQALGVPEALDDKIGIRNHSGWPMIYKHWRTNATVAHDEHHEVPERLHHTARYHRAHLQRLLLSRVPQGIIHLRKQVTTLDVEGDIATIAFQDGTSTEADLVIAADGINSVARQLYTPESKAYWTGWTSFRAVYDLSRLDEFRHVQGFEVPTEAVHYVGPDRTFFVTPLGGNLIAIVGGYAPEDIADNEQWDVPSDVHHKKFKSLYRNWTPAVRTLIGAAPVVRSYPGYSGNTPQQWVFNSRIVLTGDAAHPIGHAGFGAGMAVDDARALALALDQTTLQGSRTRSADLESSLNLFQAVRMPHAIRLGDFLSRQGKKKAVFGTGMSEENIQEWIRSREDTAWIHEHDVAEAFWATLEARQLSKS